MSNKKSKKKDPSPNLNPPEMDTAETETLIEFPCDFLIKIMGKSQQDFIDFAKKTIDHHFPNTKPDAWQQQDSKNGNYLSLSVTVYAESKTQLDAAYRELTASDLVLMAL